jgi:hypothetical protein
MLESESDKASTGMKNNVIQLLIVAGLHCAILHKQRTFQKCSQQVEGSVDSLQPLLQT